ncbi:MAG: M20/M25/M40 family metallo-hydrolase [Lachnospiraceae bacterium]|nr:M20/M25/M40 family metallo-hydrolase [Lachnospiraceae bacterium]
MLKKVQDTRKEFVEFLKEIVSIDSQPGEEKEVAERIYDELKDIGADETFIDGAGNVVSVLKGEGTGPNLLITGHMDVVPPGNLEAWGEYKPFEAVEEDGKIIGRGICDMKGGLCAQIYAYKAVVDAVRKTGKKLSGDLVFCGVVLEEPAEMFGMRYYFRDTMPQHDIRMPDLVFIGEPSMNTLCTGQRGKVELAVKTYGKVAHSSTPEAGINALEKMVPVMDAIFKREGFDLRADKTGVTPITITNCIVRPGGTLSCVPDECEICVDRRYAPGQTLDDLLKEFTDLFDRIRENDPDFKATVEPRYYDVTAWTGYVEKVPKYHPSWQTDESSEWVQRTIKALKAVGQDPMLTYSVGGTDGGITCAENNIPTMLYSGPEPFSAHQAKEYATIDLMVQNYEGYLSIISEFMGLDIDLMN